ncbi:MAG: hypothetical protein ABIJ81_02335 [Patescibacteria group bacterium]
MEDNSSLNKKNNNILPTDNSDASGPALITVIICIILGMLIFGIMGGGEGILFGAAIGAVCGAIISFFIALSKI